MVSRVTNQGTAKFILSWEIPNTLHFKKKIKKRLVQKLLLPTKWFCLLDSSDFKRIPIVFPLVLISVRLAIRKVSHELGFSFGQVYFFLQIVGTWKFYSKIGKTCSECFLEQMCSDI